MNMEIAETSTAQEAPVRRPESGEITRRANNSIFRAPALMRYDRKNDIEPKLVSIGPYYHGREKLKPMEELKGQCVRYLQQKRPVDASTSMQLVQEFMKFERDARLFYKERFDHSDLDFVQMLVNDSCFIIRVILSLSQEVQESMAFLDVNIKEVRSDLFLLENQIPLFFIQEVYKKLFPTTFNPTFPPFETVLEPFIWLDMPWRINRDAMSSKAAPAHLLDLYWRCSMSETVNNFGSCFGKVISQPLNNFQSGYLQAINERLNNIQSPFVRDVDSVLSRLKYDFIMARTRIVETIHRLGFDKLAVIEQLYTLHGLFQEETNQKLQCFFVNFEAVRKQPDNFGDQELSNFQHGIEQVVIEQLITFRSRFQKAIDDQRPLIHKEVDDFRSCGNLLARMVQLNFFRSCFEQERNEQLNNTQSDIELEMNDQLNYLSSGFDQVINEQLINFGRSGFQQEQPSLAEIYRPTNAPKVIANATVLHQMAGIKFEKLNDEHHHDGLDVIFSNGIMQMPCLKIEASQITLLVNLIAYENSKLPSMRTFSSYIKLMDALIDSEKDVELLQQCDVISNALSSHKMAATFFNDIGNFCLIDPNKNCFSDLYKNVPKYYDSSWNRGCASLRRNHFSSPWAGISVVAGVTLLLLSAFQTFYTIYGYYKPRN